MEHCILGKFADKCKQCNVKLDFMSTKKVNYFSVTTERLIVVAHLV